MSAPASFRYVVRWRSLSGVAFYVKICREYLRGIEASWWAWPRVLFLLAWFFPGWRSSGTEVRVTVGYNTPVSVVSPPTTGSCS